MSSNEPKPRAPRGPLPLRDRRERLGASQRELAGMLAVRDRSRITAWENGRSRIPAGLNADLTAIETVLEQIEQLATDAIAEAHSSDPTHTWLISPDALAAAAARTGITIPATVATRLAERVHTTCQQAGISTHITTD